MRFEVFQYYFFLAIILIGLSVSSCTHNQSSSDIISEGFNLVNNGKYDEALMKGLQAEELLKKDSKLTDQESLA
ncbi:MAG: hypothetical protein K2J82_11025, partial [Muribaculaceae bacterium]|nr:hypothetical protein [Muribaculaceae bacterium]